MVFQIKFIKTGCGCEGVWKVQSFFCQMKVTFWSSWKDLPRAPPIWAAKSNEGWKEDRDSFKQWPTNPSEGGEIILYHFY